jgi:hypothetical protein
VVKIVFAIATLLSVGASASELSCEKTVSLSVGKMLNIDETTNEVVEEVVLDKEYSELVVYLVKSSPPKGQMGVPSHSSWLVVARKGPQATCSVESVVLDTKVY